MSSANSAAQEYLAKMQASIPEQHIQAVGAPLIERSHLVRESIQNGKLKMSLMKSPARLDAKLYERPLLNKQLNRITVEKKQCESELKSLNQQFSHFDQIEKELVHNRLEEKRLTRELQQHKLKEMTEQAKNNIKLWHQQKIELQQKKKEIADRHQELTERMKKQQLLMEAKELEQRRLKKKQQYDDVMKQIQQRRRRRQEIQQKEAAKPQEVPKYIEMRDKWKSEEEQKKFELEFLKKKQKSERSINFAKIKEHEKNYMTVVKEKNIEVKQAEHASDFSLFRTMEEKKQDRERQKRRMSYQSKISQIHVEISDQKQLEAQVLRDKTLHPIKYVILGQKGLSDFQIFEQFKDFQFQNDARKLGKDYLNEQKEKHKEILQQEKRPKSLDQRSASQDLQSGQKVPPKYINYLPTLSLKKLDEIESVMRNKKNKDTKISMLIERSAELEEEALKKIQKVRSDQVRTYNEAKRAQDEIDKLYALSLRTKLACAELAT